MAVQIDIADFEKIERILGEPGLTTFREVSGRPACAALPLAELASACADFGRQVGGQTSRKLSRVL